MKWNYLNLLENSSDFGNNIEQLFFETPGSELSRRYSFDGKYVRENCKEQKHFDFSASTSGVLS